MISFLVNDTGVELEYKGDSDSLWLWEKLKQDGEARVSRAFWFTRADLLNPPSETQDPEFYSSHADLLDPLSETQDLEFYSCRFQFGHFEDDYVKIKGRILNSKNDVWISRDVNLKRSIFVAARDISIFGWLSKLLENSDPILIGGNGANAIPWDVFEELLKKFPNTYELNRYADARVHTILSQYLDGMKDARGRYERYLNKKATLTTAKALDLDVLKKLEIEKYVLIRDIVQDALVTKTDWSESDWQKLMLSFLLLLFPKYIKVLENVTIHDYYTEPGRKINRYIDIALIDSNGTLDIIEVKKPFDDKILRTGQYRNNKILRKGQYRNNNIPTSELSGSIMQAEKYLFHLSKWGVEGEKTLTKRYASKLPADMTIRISNPKAIIIVGRDQIGGANMTHSQLLDFEVIKRKYANIMDIITYDDLLRRLNNTITALRDDSGTRA